MTALRDAIDTTTLGWIKPELDETLRQARMDIEAFAEDPADTARMRFCAGFLHQVHGTLRMVELYAPAMVAEEMERLAHALAVPPGSAGGVADRDEACGALMRGVVLLPDYLERLQGGHKDIPIVLLPLLNELRAARGETGLSESVLFAPDLDRPLPADLPAPTPLPRQSRQLMAGQQLSTLRDALAAWPEDGAPANAAGIAKAIDALLESADHDSTRRMLWVASSVAAALRDGAITATRAMRQAFAGVEREARNVFEGDSFNAPRPEPTFEPTRQLLYHVAHSDGKHQALDALRNTFNLSAHLPTESELAHARGSLSGRNRALLDTVAAAIKEDLLRVKDSLDLHLRTKQTGVADLHPQVEALGRVADTLGMMGLGVARNVVLQQRDAMHDIVAGNRPADEGALLDIAGALLYVDASLDDQVDRLGRPNEGEASDPIASESRKVLEVLVREAITNFSDARQAFVAFVETSWDHAQLDNVPRLLDEVGGALRILDLAQPADYLVGIRKYTEAELIGRKRVPNGQQLDTLADALASIEYYLEALREQRPSRDGILDIARQSLETLRYWPLPQDVAPVEAPVEAAPVAEHDVAFDLVDAPVALSDDTIELVSAPTHAVEPTPAIPVPPPAPAYVPAPVATGVAGGFEATGDEIDDEIREVFLEEFEEEIGHLEQMLPAWRNAPDDVEKLRPIRRVFHTLKGSGRLVGARTLGEFSWKIENMLNRVLDGSRPASPAVIALVEQAFYTLPQLHAALRGEGALSADLAGIEAIADRVAAGEEATYVAAAPVAAVVAPVATTVAMDAADSLAPAVTGDSDEVTVPATVDPVLLEILGTEVGGHLVTIDAWLAQAQARPVAANDALLRAMHTMNGAFAMTEVPAITNVTGPAETYIKRLLAAHALPTAQGVAALAATAEAIRRTVTALQTDAPRVPVFEALARQVVALRDELPEAKTPLLPTEPVEADLDALEHANLELAGVADLREFTDLAEATPVDTGLALQDTSDHAVEEVTLQGEDLSAFLDLSDAIPVDAGLPINEAAEGGADHVVVEDIVLDGTLDTASLDAASFDVGSDGLALEEFELEGDAADAAAIEAQAGLEASLLEAERVEAERLETQRLDAERAQADRAEAERAEAARAEAEHAEAQRLEAERAEFERIESERLEAERAESERAEAQRVEALLLEAERLEAERIEAERLDAERAETERVEAERLEAERLEAQRAEAERAEAERAEAERAEAERVESERVAAEAEAERVRLAEEAEYAALEAEYEAERLAREHAAAEAAKLAEDAAAPQPEAEAPAVEEPVVEEPAVEATVAESEDAEPAVAQMLADAVASANDPDEALDLTDLDPELVDIFVEEGVDLLDHSDGLLAQLRNAPGEREHLVGLQRDLHTLKGGARMAGIMAVGELGHAMESLLEAVVEHRSELGRDGIPLLERGFDRLHAMVTRVGERRAIAMPEQLIAQFDARAKGRTYEPAAEVDTRQTWAAPKAELKPLSAPIMDAGAGDDDDIGVRAPQEQVRIRADLLDRLVNYAGEVAIYRSRLEQQLGNFRGAMGEMEATNQRLRDQLRRLDIETEAQIIARYQREHDTADQTFDPLELDRFSTLQQLSRGLAESAADMSSLQGSLEDLTRQYETLLLQQSRVSSELQEGLMRTRMVPFDALVPRLRRVVRQAAADTGKNVQLKLDGAQGELDRNVLERMTAPLEHMLRNAVAHGLESPGDRRKHKKSEEGTIRIAVRREGSEVVLEVGDDGAGLNRNAIRKRAEERGLIRSDAVLADADLDALIMEPGFSTADTVSRLAGRGVGMDVVASEVRQLGGALDIKSKQGEGTTFTLRLPQTLAVTQAVFVKIGETTYAVPIASVRGVGRVTREALAKNDATYAYGGEEYALHDLGLLLGHAAAKAEGQLQMPLLLIRAGELRAAVSIDQVLGNREIVVKPVGPQVGSVPGIFGATIMGDGSVVVILDVAPLVRRQAALPRDTVPAPQPEKRHVPLVMVVDDSVTMRKVTGRVLERHNFEVTTAKDGVDALERLEERVPDLMLLDIEMPRMDGYELATAMKADPRFRNVPIMMITSRTGEKHRQRAFDIGVERYLGKPYQEHELLRNVFELIAEKMADGVRVNG